MIPPTYAPTPKTPAQPCELADLPTLTRRFPPWRATRVRGQRISADLWQAAIALARFHGIYPAVAALKLNYYDLQRRLSSGSARQDVCAPAPVFVKLVPRASGGLPGVEFGSPTT